MTPTKIFSILLFLVAIGLGYFLVDSIKYRIDEKTRVARNEARVIEKLKMIRDAETAYLAVHGRYTDNWDSLISFIRQGRIPNVVKRETVIPLAYGADSVYVEYDTLGYASVRDSLFSPSKYPTFNPETLPVIPDSDGQRFELFAGTVTTPAGATVNVFEAKDVYVLNKDRLKETHPYGPLRVGSQNEASIQGNWE
ncbi:hypothetical protein [Cesiribacter sp. SM1]|uniref:hypothetical protein n=1 Tax=Cesiribacter sp. SM1 TaxID=2861196 RepID=UPI001CD7EF89|nr:hypothetical protein [Cesiribacter sp. SM1]